MQETGPEVKMPVHQAKFLQPLKRGQRFVVKGKVLEYSKK